MNNGDFEVEFRVEKNMIEKLADIGSMVNLIDESKEELINFRPTLLGNAMHMGEKAYFRIYEQYETILRLYNHFADLASRDLSERDPYYKKETLNSIEEVKERMVGMYLDLEYYERKYVPHYSKQIVKK